jgi:hypothetical protein
MRCQPLPRVTGRLQLPKSLVTLAIGALLCISSFFISPHCVESGYYFVAKQKHLLLENSPSPKVVFVGGSNLAFGLDSPALERKFQRPVINMGMCDMFGLRYIFGEIADSIKSGDLVVVVPEYYMLEFGADGTSELFRDIEAYPPSALWILKTYAQSPDSFSKLVAISHSYVRGKWRPVIDSCVNALRGDASFRALRQPCEPQWCFDRQGDFLGHLNSAPLSHNTFPLSSGRASDESVYLINQFSRKLEARGAKLVLLPCPIPKNSYELAPTNITRMFEQLRGSCAVTMPVQPQRYVFPTNNFYETPYHLNAVGRKVRTLQVAEDLQDFVVSTKLAAGPGTDPAH